MGRIRDWLFEGVLARISPMVDLAVVEQLSRERWEQGVVLGELAKLNERIDVMEKALRFSLGDKQPPQRRRKRTP